MMNEQRKKNMDMHKTFIFIFVVDICLIILIYFLLFTSIHQPPIYLGTALNLLKTSFAPG